MSKKNLALVLALFACMTLTPKAFAANYSDTETYTVSIPAGTSVTLKAGESFGAIALDQANDTNAHVITVGNGGGNDSFVQSNDPSAPNKQYTVTFGSVGGSVIGAGLGTSGGKAVLTVSNAAATASVNIFLSDDTKSALPKLGSPTASGVPFVISGNTLDIAASSSVPYASNKAALNMLMDLDESTVTTGGDQQGDVEYTMTLSILNI